MEYYTAMKKGEPVTGNHTDRSPRPYAERKQPDLQSVIPFVGRAITGKMSQS